MDNIFSHIISSKIEDNGKFFKNIVSNPPYQQSFHSSINTQNHRDTSVGNIFHYFQNIAHVVSSSTTMIYPGERWLRRAGHGMKDFGLQQINDNSLNTVVFYPDSRKIFGPNVYVSGGITIVYLEDDSNDTWTLQRYDNNGFDAVNLSKPGDKFISMSPWANMLLKKIEQKDMKNINYRMTPQRFFGFESSFVERNYDKVIPCNEDFTNRPTANHIAILTNDKAGKMGRVKWCWIDKNLIRKNDYAVDMWKVIISTNNLTGDNGRSPMAQILQPGFINGRSRVIIGLFTNQEEAENYLKFLQNPLIRTLLSISGNYQTTFGRYVPDFENYLHNPYIDFSLNTEGIYQQLLEFFDISEKEKMRIEEFSSHFKEFCVPRGDC